MSELGVADRVADTKRAAYVPPLQRTTGQPPPIAAHGGLSYMSFDRNGDAGTAEALNDALAEIATGESQRLIDRIAANPKDIEAYERLGEYYLEIENWNYAKECFKQVLKLNPRNIGARSRMRKLERILSRR